MQRIVSLIASATEIVCALGFEKHLIGRSHECDFPESVKRLPICTEPKFAVEGSSAEIDQRVKNIVQDGLSVYRVHTEMLRQLRPDVIVTQSHCEVCAVSQRDVEAAVCDWIGTRPKIVSLAPNALADVWDSIRQVADALGAPQRSEELIRRLQMRISEIADQARALPTRPTVAFIEWIDPLMAGGNWMPELIDLACGVNLFGEAGKHSPWMTWEELRRRDPEVIFVAPCGFDLKRTRHEMTALTRRPDWPELRAARAGRVYLADGNQYFNRPGPRLVNSLEILAEVLHPEAFLPRLEGPAWQHL